MRAAVATALKDVLDPELFVSIVDLGLLYNIRIEKKTAIIEMTLTTMGCPLFGVLEEDIKRKSTSIDGITDAEVKLVFDPPWDIRMVSPEAQAQLGID